MWPQLIEDIQLELKLLHELLAQCGPLREAVASDSADETQKLAAASLLQSFYNGVENVLDALAERIDGDRPTGPDRHETLLTRMAAATDSRPAVLSQELLAGLRHYLEFRNSYRYSHYFRLDWPTMAGLVNQCGETLDRLEAELDRFVRARGKQRFLGRPEPRGLPDYWFAPPPYARPAAPVNVRRVCAIAAAVGLALGVAATAAWHRLSRPAGPESVPPAEVRRLALPLAAQLGPWHGEPAVRHAIGVLEFFETNDWRFLRFGPDAKQPGRAGGVEGWCESLAASARLAFAEGDLRQIEIRTAWDAYRFGVTAGRLTRASRHKLPDGRPDWLIELDRDGRPAYIGDWREDDRGTVRHDRYFRDGRLLLEAVSRPDGTVEKVTLRTGADPNQTTTYTATATGLLGVDPNAAGALSDLGGFPASRPGK